jgi:hypothetical protein
VQAVNTVDQLSREGREEQRNEKFYSNLMVGKAGRRMDYFRDD